MAQGCEAKHVYQVDLYKPAPGLALGPRVMRAIQDGCSLLLSLAPPEPDGLSDFRRAFRQRYEDQEVPLLQALDEEMGIGFPASSNPPVHTFFPGTPRHDLMLSRLHRAWTTGERNIELTAEEIKTLQARNPRSPRSFAACVTLAAASAEAADTGNFLAHIEGLRGPTAGAMLGRFCNGSEQLTEQLRDLGRREQEAEGEAILAELVHVPSGRVGNVIARPLLRQYEIPLLARSGADEADQIALTDLRVSVVGERVVLRSQRLGREVIPALSSAHSFMDSALSLYRFFGLLAAQGGSWAGWRWGCFSNAPFLPRISHGRIILQLARWRVVVAESGLTAAQSPEEVQAAVTRLRAERALPRFVSLEDGDTGFVLDLDNPVCAGTLADIARKHKALVLGEAFPAPDEMPVRGPEGRFVGELMIPFIREANPAPARTRPAARASGGRRRFAVRSRLAPGGCTRSCTPAPPPPRPSWNTWSLRWPAGRARRPRPGPGSSCATAIPNGTSGFASRASPTGCGTSSASVSASSPTRRCRRASSGGCRWIPTSARSKGTAARRASTWPRPSSPPTATASWTSWQTPRATPGSTPDGG